MSTLWYVRDYMYRSSGAVLTQHEFRQDFQRNYTGIILKIIFTAAVLLLSSYFAISVHFGLLHLTFNMKW